nr:hypothetical protein [uncultured Rhodopila sp.]
MGGAWKDLWASLKSVVAATAAGVAFVLALLGSIWEPGGKVQIGLISIAVIGFAVITALVYGHQDDH